MKNVKIVKPSKFTPTKDRDVQSLLELIRPRPALYFGSNSITRLQSFIDGYSLATVDYNDGEQRWRSLLSLFTYWLANYYSTEGTPGWHGILLTAAGGDDIAALSLFYEKWDEFLADPDKEQAEEKYNQRWGW